MKISQSLIKEVLKQDHCPKQILFSFEQGKELYEPSENMLLGRYFESELLGACRGGEKQEAKFLKGGEKATAYRECDKLIEFAKECFNSIGFETKFGRSQINVETEFLVLNIDHLSSYFKGKKAIIDVKWTATKPDDRWNGWGDFDSMTDQHIQACHYTLGMFEKTGEWFPFYFFVFGKDFWFRPIKVSLTENAINVHKSRISYTTEKIRQYSENNFKGNGDFNKCYSCPFKNECEDKAVLPEIETFLIE